MSAIKIHIKKVVINDQGCIKLTKEAAAIAADVATKAGKPVKQVVSEIIVQAYQNGLITLEGRESSLIVLDKEE